jgi:hypothetical protein
MSKKTLIQRTIINVISTVEYGYINVTLTCACYLGSYDERLKFLDMTTLETRRVRGI